jgi:glucose/arabinose dehydrogenase
MSIRKALVALVAGTLTAPALAPATAQNSSVTVVARGLDNPRGLDIGPAGNVFVAETGKAGDNCRNPNECYGFTGAITKITDQGQKRVRVGLLSLGGKDGSFTVGANDVVVRSQRGIFTIMSSIGPKPRRIGNRVAHQSGNLLKLPTRLGKKIVAQIDKFEFRQNPDGLRIDSNPYGLEIGGGYKYVVDAGGNSLIRVGANRSKKLLKVFPQRTFGSSKIDSVPTSATLGPDGNLYVGELGGDGTPENKARVWRVQPDGDATIDERAFDTIVSVAFGPDDSLYVVEFLRDGFSQLETGDFTGALWRIKPNGNRTELARGRLTAPGGVAVAENGDVYVSVNSVFPGRGQVLKITGS